MERVISKVVRNTLSTFALRFLTIIASLVAIPVLIDTIGPAGYGLVVLAGTISGYLALLGAGIPAGTTKYVAEFHAREDPDAVVRVVNTSLVFFALVGTIAGGLLAGFVLLGGLDLFQIEPGRREEARDVLLIAAGLAPLLWPANALSSTLEGLQHHHKRNVASGATTFLLHAGAIGAALAGLGVVWVFVAQQAAILLRIAWFARIVKQVLPAWRPSRLSYHHPTFKLILSLSIWILVGQLAGLLHYRADHILLSGFIAVGAVATYDIVMRPFHFIREMLSLFNSAVMPAVSAIEVTDGASGVDAITYTGSRYSFAFAAPFCLIGVFLSGPFIVLWIGPEMVPYTWLAQVACLSRLIVMMNGGGVFGQVAYGTGKVRRIGAIAVVTALLNVGLSIWWVELWGIAGVVIATLVAFTVQVPLQYLFVFPELGIERWRFIKLTVIGPLVPHLLVTAVLVPFWDHFQAIDGWLSLLFHSALLSALFFPFTWRAVAPEHRRWLLDKVARKLGRARSVAP